MPPNINETGLSRFKDKSGNSEQFSNLRMDKAISFCVTLLAHCPRISPLLRRSGSAVETQLQDLRVGLESVGFDGHCFGFPASFRNLLVRLELDLFELVPGRKRLLLRRYLGFDRIVEVFGEFEINDVELIDEDVPILKPDL